MDLHDGGFPPSPARLQGFTPGRSRGARATRLGRRELDAACLAPRLCAFRCVKCGVNSGDRVRGKVTSGGVGSCQPAQPGRTCPPPTRTCPGQESCACSNVAQAGSCLGVCLADVGKVPHRPWMSPPATCHPASDSTTREVCLGFHERPFWACWRVGTSPREGTPTVFLQAPPSRAASPALGIEGVLGGPGDPQACDGPRAPAAPVWSAGCWR